jgi:hypothetical protein
LNGIIILGLGGSFWLDKHKLETVRNSIF